MLSRTLARRVAVAATTALMALLFFAALGGVPLYQAAAVELGTEIDRISTRDRVVSLTFDDAWIDAHLESILDTLEEGGIRATFFPTGVGIESGPELARRIAAEGHEIGSHGLTHSKMRAMSDDELVSQLQRTEEAFSAAGLRDPTPLFRAPWGEVDSGVLEVLGEQGYLHVAWTARGGDNVAGRSAAEVAVRIMRDVQPGAIIVMHTNNDVAPRALPELIRRLKDKGYGFVTLGEALLSAEQAMARYQQTSPLISYWGEWYEQASSMESGGSAYRADSGGAAALATFTGTTFELLASKGPDRGKLMVIIDGEGAQEIDLYSAAEEHRVTIFAARDLPDDTHTALVLYGAAKNPASTGYGVSIDALQVAGSLVQAPSLRVPVLTGGWDILEFVSPSTPERDLD